jgi:membrane-bound lytic murein transglycosylase A
MMKGNFMAILFAIMHWTIVVTVILIVGADGEARSAAAECRATSAVPLSADQLPAITDDFSRESLLSALDNSVRYWQKQQEDKVVELCGTLLSPSRMVESLISFKTVYSESPADELGGKLADNFYFCKMNGARNILVTGYYQPILQASLEKKEPFIFPLYRLPSDLIKIQTTSNGTKQVQIGRFVDGELRKYWSREEIDKGQHLKGYEIAYLEDPLDAFFLQVQGSGLLQLQDGTVRTVLYAGSNGRKYKSIGKLLADEGRIPLEDVTMPSIRRYLHEHLDEQQRILQYNERYIFFRLGEENEQNAVVGSMGKELTPGRSAAFDQACFPYGIPAFLSTRKPVFADGKISGWQPMKRFVFNQDSGSAIKGAGRLDLFLGNGPEAEAEAGVLKEQGSLYFILKRSLQK